MSGTNTIVRLGPVGVSRKRDHVRSGEERTSASATD